MERKWTFSGLIHPRKTRRGNREDQRKDLTDPAAQHLQKIWAHIYTPMNIYTNQKN